MASNTYLRSSLREFSFNLGVCKKFLWLAMSSSMFAMGCVAQPSRVADSTPVIPASSAVVAMPEDVPEPYALPWAKESRSPQFVTADKSLHPLLRGCLGGVDEGLVQAASEVAAKLSTSGELPDTADVEWRLRKAGEPHVWPRTWAAHGARLDPSSLAADVVKWLGDYSVRARCGAALVKGSLLPGRTGEHDAAVVIMVDPLADLAPMPTKAALGSWVDLDAQLLFGAREGRVVLLPPVGMPLTLLSSTTAGHVRAKLPMSKPGRYVVQVLATDSAGPRPVLEAEIWSGVTPTLSKPSSEVPGESAGEGSKDPQQALFLRLNAARRSEGLAPLVRDPVLEKVAIEHVRAMRKAKLLGHDVGDGDPGRRATEAGAKWRVLGENVARARSGVAAHRALYASPSHRGNMLDARFIRVGIGVEVDPAGEEWVAQMFAG